MAGTATRGSQARAIAQGRVIPQAGESALPLLAVLLRRRVMPPEQIADRLLVAWVGAPIRRGWTVRERLSWGGARRIRLEQLAGMRPPGGVDHPVLAGGPDPGCCTP